MLFTPGLAVGAASGSMGGVTASHNRGGQYFRRRAVPSNPLSTFSATVRSSLGDLSNGWRALLPEQQAAWSEAAESTTVVNALGTTIHLTGQQLYIRANQRLNLYNPGGAIAVPPATWEVAALTAFGITLAEVDGGALTALDLAVTPGTTPANTILLLRATPPMMLGINNVRKYLRTIGEVVVTAGVADALTAYTDRFSTAAAIGARIWLEASYMSQVNGQISPPLLANALTEAA